ncbi:MAG: TlpA disulfide reductase family protein [Thiotrichales bacterium]
MNKIWLVGLLALLSIPPTSAAPVPVNLEQYRGKVVYLDFWASWCAPCKKSFPWMEQMQSRHGADGLQVVAISVDEDEADLARFLATQPVSFAVAHDPTGGMAREFELVGMPSSFLLNREGQIVKRHVGFKTDKAAEYEADIKALLSGGAR